ncbi:NUDIX hydrolase [Intrasporangium sp. YIM S08009]|uniref:NUDIX hydrolase n=1 Tax=Intrasporangium zincisolvens TaxID=3080018 RepID=UPI002B052F7A|nr:NUDIX domain-containing protein [Intrasporangium sp. YIM S08009]
MGTHDVTETPRHSVSVAAAIFDETGENVLLIKRRDNGHWEPPGGVLELDETIEEGLRREVREETGAEVDVETLSGVYKNMRRGIVALVFRARLLSEPKPSTEEATEVAWVQINTVPDIMVPAFGLRITDAAATGVSIRSHDGQTEVE